MILIELFIKGKQVGVAKNIQMDCYATSFLRKFYIYDVDLEHMDIFSEEMEALHTPHLEVNVCFLNKNKSYLSVDNFELLIHSIDYTNLEEIIVEGNLKSDEDNRPSYDQGIIDVYNFWNQGLELQFNKLPSGISTIDYINACLCYSSISDVTPKKEEIEIDFQYLSTEPEFVCFFAEEFMGKRSYMGRYLDTFKDCLLTLYKKRKKHFDDKKVILRYKNLVLDDELKDIILEAEKLLLRYGFKVESV